MRHECHPKLKTFTFRSELVLLCAKLDPAFFVRCYQVWCNVNCCFECSKCIKKVNDTFIFCYFSKIFFFISVSCYFAFDFVFSYIMAKNVRIYIVLNKINGVTKMYWVYIIVWRKQLFSRVCDRKKIHGKYVYSFRGKNDTELDLISIVFAYIL